MSNPIPLGCPSPADLQASPGLRPEVTQAEAENVGNSQEAPAEPGAASPPLANIGRRKTADDLFELIPSESPIQQAKLFEAARASGINEKYARKFLSVLIADRRILVRKIPRSKAKCALGFMRAPAQVESRYTAEELSPTS
jgi:hypothetical protein